jgi:hypothetical protein
MEFSFNHCSIMPNTFDVSAGHSLCENVQI